MKLSQPNANMDQETVSSFGDEWSLYDQSELDTEELHRLFESYFAIFPWQRLPAAAEGFDMGCGSGRWAGLVAPRVGRLHCIDASPEALDVCRRNLAGARAVEFHRATTDTVPLDPESQDFGYSLGVLHHIPDTARALADCVRLLKPGAPFLVYLYYRFDNRPAWFRLVWQASETLRAVISRLPSRAKSLVTDFLAVTVYWPLARLSRLGEAAGLPMRNMPLYFYRDANLFTMRTDSRDRFGTPLEQRFTRKEIAAMMEQAGLRDVRFSEAAPYWCAVGIKA